MLDKYGYVHYAIPSTTTTDDGGVDDGGASGSSNAHPLYTLDTSRAPVYVGPGRPLAFHYDAHGNLIICDSLKVCGMGVGRGVGGVIQAVLLFCLF